MPASETHGSDAAESRGHVGDQYAKRRIDKIDRAIRLGSSVFSIRVATCGYADEQGDVALAMLNRQAATLTFVEISLLYWNENHSAKSSPGLLKSSTVLWCK